MDYINAYIREVRFSNEAVDSSVYPYNLAAVRNLTTLKFDPHITFIIGENGAGKSTLIEAIAVGYGLNPEGGSKNFNFASYASHSDLAEHVIITKGARRASDAYFLRAESFYNVASNIQQLDSDPYGSQKIIRSYGGKSLHSQSHGQAFMALVKNRFGGDGLYIMDEPEAALSIRRQMELLVEFSRLIARKSQLIIATHSPILLSYPGAQIYNLTDDGYRSVHYEDTDQFQLTKYFLGNYKEMLKELLGDNHTNYI